MRVVVMALALLAASASSAAASDWNVRRLRDEFTDAETCRVEPGGEFSRSFARGLMRAFRTLHFIVENRNGEVRAGFMSEPLMPIPGDMQVRVDQNPLITITPADSPVDSGPAIALPVIPNVPPEVRAAQERAIQAALSAGSPYRLLTGERARDLLRQILAGQDTRWRAVTINAASSDTGRIPTRGLADAIRECGIDLTTPEASPPPQAPAPTAGAE